MTTTKEQLAQNQQEAEAQSYVRVLREFFRAVYVAAIAAGKDDQQALKTARTAVANDGRWCGGMPSPADPAEHDICAGGSESGTT